MTEALTDRRYSPQCLYADSAYEYAEYMKPSEILNKIYCVLVHIEKIWYYQTNFTLSTTVSH